MRALETLDDAFECARSELAKSVAAVRALVVEESDPDPERLPETPPRVRRSLQAGVA